MPSLYASSSRVTPSYWQNIKAKAVEDKKIPGFVFGATSVDEEIYFMASGNRIVDDPSSAPVTEDTVFWICSQTKMLVHVRVSNFLRSCWKFSIVIQLAALQLMEREKIALEDPVVDCIPQMANPVILEDEMAENLVYTPAKNVARVKHLLNFTNGMFYPFKGATRHSQMDAYTTLHPKNDYVTGFVIVRRFTTVP